MTLEILIMIILSPVALVAILICIAMLCVVIGVLIFIWYCIITNIWYWIKAKWNKVKNLIH